MANLDNKIKIKFQEEELLLIGTKNEGEITTEELHKNSLLSIAHLTLGGDILRFGIKLGTIEDIEFLDD